MTKRNKDRRKSSAHKYKPPLPSNYKKPHAWKYKKTLKGTVQRLPDNWEKVEM